MATPAPLRSILPHEPLPLSGLGYINIQGSFLPKNNTKAKRKEGENGSLEENDEKKQCEEEPKEEDKTQIATQIAVELKKALEQLPFPHQIQSLEVFSCCTKAKAIYENPLAARDITYFLKTNKTTPSDLLHSFSNDSSDKNKKYSTKALQVNQLTDTLLPSQSWKYASPPKFRRLLPTPENEKTIDNHQNLDELRNTTRFVFLSGLISEDDEKSMEVYQSVMEQSVQQGKGQDTVLLDAIRNVMNQYDSSGYGVELWLPNKKKKIGTAQYCYIGMRSHEDAENLILGLQNQQIDLHFPSLASLDNSEVEMVLTTQKLFLDWADVARRFYKNDPTDDTQKAGLPSRSECTSTTDSVHIPGLAIIPNFIPSEQEEEVLLAAIIGPNAPWAPKQKRQSGDEPVKRRVQHYGYVFDYATADVLRTRDKENMGGGGGCPPLPAIRDTVKSDADVEDFIKKSVEQLNGWDTFAGIIERTRRTDFFPFLSHDPSDDNNTKSTSNPDNPLKYSNINQVTINEYAPGQGIGSHVDTPSAFGDGLISISLNGGCVMEFRKHNQSGEKDNDERKLVHLPPRSALLMSGDARYKWEHMIANRRTDTVNGTVIPRKLRVSLTLRTALKESSDTSDGGAEPMEVIESCKFPLRWHCSQNGPDGDMVTIDSSHLDSKNSTSKNGYLITPECEKNHVHAVYDAVAEQWHHTRGKRGVLWPRATQFLENQSRGSIVADVGCGDGKYFAAGWTAGCYVIGTDISLPLLQTAMGGSGGADPRQVKYDESGASAKPAMAVADCLNLPLQDGCCDAAICIAVMHHLSSEERRLQCLRELRRVVKLGGLINVQAWALEQEAKSKRKFAGTDVFVPFNAQPRYLNKVQVEEKPSKQEKGSRGSANGTKGVAEIYSQAYEGAEFDENKGLVVFKRYCHMYRHGELDELVEQVDGLSLIESGYESGNHFVLLQVTK